MCYSSAFVLFIHGIFIRAALSSSLKKKLYLSRDETFQQVTRRRDSNVFAPFTLKESAVPFQLSQTLRKFAHPIAVLEAQVFSVPTRGQRDPSLEDFPGRGATEEPVDVKKCPETRKKGQTFSYVDVSYPPGRASFSISTIIV